MTLENMAINDKHYSGGAQNMPSNDNKTKEQNIVETLSICPKLFHSFS